MGEGFLLNWIEDDEDGDAEYDRMTAQQITEMNQESQEVNQAEEIRAALVADDLEGIRFWAEDIGAMVAVREAFPGNNAIHHLTRHAINLETREIEDLAKEIDGWKAEN